MMLSGLLAGVARLRVTVGYAVAIAAVTVVMLCMDPTGHDALIRHASTNLHNLGHGRTETLVGSAFVVDAGPIYLWLPGLVCLLAVTELIWGSARLVVAFGVGHIGATLVVAAGLVTAVQVGWMSRSVAHASDVGMSYGAMAVLGVLTAAIPVCWRPAWTGWWLAVAAFVVVSPDRGFTDVGHAVAMLLGMALSTCFVAPSRWTVTRTVLLIVAALFGFLLLTDDVPIVVFGPLSALAGSVALEMVSGLRRAAAEKEQRVSGVFLHSNKGRPWWGAPLFGLRGYRMSTK